MGDTHGGSLMNVFRCLGGRVRFVSPRFFIAGAGSFPQAIGQQDFRANGFKTVPTPHSLCQLHQPVQAFGVPGCISVGEVVENGVPVVFNRQRERQERFVDRRRDVCKPGKVTLQSSLFCLGLVDVVKRLFEVVGGFQSGKVFQPSFDDQDLLLIQGAFVSEQQESVVHQRSALLVGQAGTNFLTDCLQASREQLEDVKLVYHQVGMWQDLTHGIMVARPHIGADDRDVLFDGIGQALQVTDHGWFGALPQQINNLVALDIGDHAAVLMQQVQFVNAQIEQLSLWNARLKVCRKFAKERANGTFCQTDLIGDADKGSSQGLLLDVVNQAIGHEMTFIHPWERLKEGTAASTTKKSAALNGDPDTFASDGQVHEQLRLSLVAMQLVLSAMDTLKRRGRQHHLEMKIVGMFIHDKNAKVSQAQEIQGHLSQRVLPKIFLLVAVFPVARERRLLRVSCCGPTHFRDVEKVCWSVKNGAIPRGIANSLMTVVNVAEYLSSAHIFLPARRL